MRQFLFARTGQPQTPTRTHPLFARAGAAAADLWLNLPVLTMADFRDLRFRNLLSGLTHDVDDDARREAFNRAFACQIALSIAHRSHAQAAPCLQRVALVRENGCSLDQVP
jgi:hypothetical protein